MRIVCAALLFLASCGTEPSSGDDGKPAGAGDRGTVIFDVRGHAPPVQGSNTFDATLTTVADDAALAGATVVVDVIMPAHGHRGPQVHVRELGGGRYVADDVVFTMPGTWEVTWHASGSGVEDQQTLTYEIE